MKGILFLTLFASQYVLADIEFRDQFRHCQGEKVKNLHQEALELTKNAYQKLQSYGLFSADISHAFKKYFRLDVFDVNDEIRIKRVVYNLSRVAQNAKKTNYTCHEHNRGLWCLKKNVVAIVPPPKKVVYFCPIFFKQRVKDQVETVIHEWFHRWGGNRIDYLPETYWYQVTKNTPISTLVRSSDQYVLFIRSLNMSYYYF